MRKINLKRVLAFFIVMVFMLLTTVPCETKALAKTRKATKITITSPQSSILNMMIGDTYSMKTTNAGNKKVTYKSNNNKIVKVTSDGKLTALKIGAATITVKANDGSNAKATLKVNVGEKVTKAQFTTKNNYHSYMNINFALPEGVLASDITSIKFTVDTKKALALRLYAGDGSVVKSDNSELTSEETKIEDSVAGTEDVTENGKKVRKTKHKLTENIVNSTRISVAAGNIQNVAFKVDDHAKLVLSSIKGNVVSFGIYAHNIAPSYSIYNVQIQTALKTYDVKLTDDIVGGLAGGTVTLEK